uniref:Uncharacterized protein n=1 Tax=Solanum lycopersicum TaxID=4081 RepID=A0A3Q7FY32_SOLLC
KKLSPIISFYIASPSLNPNLHCQAALKEKSNNGCLHLCVRAMEKETVRCYEVLAKGEVLGVPSAPIYCPCHQAYPS